MNILLKMQGLFELFYLVLALHWFFCLSVIVILAGKVDPLFVLVRELFELLTNFPTLKKAHYGFNENKPDYVIMIIEVQ